MSIRDGFTDAHGVTWVRANEPQPPATDTIPLKDVARLEPTFHNRAITDRLKAAERCVLAIQEALTGEKPDGVLDYDQTREYLLSVIK